jgi:hypothetical protein
MKQLILLEQIILNAPMTNREHREAIELLQQIQAHINSIEKGKDE